MIEVQRKFRSTIHTWLTVAALSVMVTDVHCQPIDAGWLPWVGCWEPVHGAATEDLLCVLPSDEAGAVEVLRFGGEVVLSRETVRADGERYGFGFDSCEGWGQGSFSSDSHRVFLNSVAECGTDGTVEESHLWAFYGWEEWLAIRVVNGGDDRSVWIQRYVLVEDDRVTSLGFWDLIEQGDSTAVTARRVAAMPLSLDDVIEANAFAPIEAIELLLVELGDGFNVSSARLVQMADAGVSEDLIDVVVATSFPQWFAAAVVEAERPDIDEPVSQRPFFVNPYSYRRHENARFFRNRIGQSGRFAAEYGRVIVVVELIKQERRRARRGYSSFSAGSDYHTAALEWEEIEYDYDQGYHEASGATSAGNSSTGRTAKPRSGRGD